jgi:hypothetical protein
MPVEMSGGPELNATLTISGTGLLLLFLGLSPMIGTLGTSVIVNLGSWINHRESNATPVGTDGNIDEN